MTGRIALAAAALLACAGPALAQPAVEATSSAEDCLMLETAFREYLPHRGVRIPLPLKTRLSGVDFNNPPLPTDPAALERERAETAAYLGRAFPELTAAQRRDLALGHERRPPAAYTLSCRWRLRFLPARAPNAPRFPNFEWVPPIRSQSGALAVAPMSYFLSPTFSRSGVCLFERQPTGWRIRRCATITLS
jgi:hypothetical protein